MNKENLKNGDIIRFINKPNDRDWVLIHKDNCRSLAGYEKYRKSIKDHTGFYMLGGLWYSGDALTDEPYGKYNGQLHVGDFPNIRVIGNIHNAKDYQEIKMNERLTLNLLPEVNLNKVIVFPRASNKSDELTFINHFIKE